ncbi:hypothetical protein [Nonomuraea sp. B1E8]|uniref:hypothetical protein n=1 Tax=unclassified Nonomuraea TaxID=2593643 RepID=UPI00325D8047
MRTQSARCCVGGGGPAEIMTGLLPARQSVEVIVLEKARRLPQGFPARNRPRWSTAPARSAPRQHDAAGP